MKKFLLKTLLFFVLMAVIDVMAGGCFTWLRSKAHGGQTYKIEYIANLCKDDILILGSSKADHHYIPEVIEDSLGLTVYNAGEMGCGIIPAYMRYKMVSGRRKPKLVLYDLTPGYDYLYDGGYSQYLGSVRPYAGRKEVHNDYIDFSDEMEELRLLSNLYRNNSKLVMNIRDIFRCPDKWKGYEPIYGKIDMDKDKENYQEKSRNQMKMVDSLKYSYMELFIVETLKDDVPLMFVLSPTVDTESDEMTKYEYEQAYQLSEKYSIPLLNNRYCEGITNNRDFFQDEIHLNHAGAMAYSQYVVSQIRKTLAMGRKEK